MWSNRTNDGSRSDLDYRPFPSVWEAVQSEDGNCLGKECPRHKECFFYRARRRAQNANLLIVNHALFVTDLALRGAGFPMLPDYEIAIIDEAHTLEAVAGEHLGLKLSSIGVDYSLSRLANERTGRGLLAVHKLDDAVPLVRKARTAAEDFFETIADWYHRQSDGFNGRVRKPIGCAETLTEELNKLATAVGQAARGIEARTERIELEAAEQRCRSLAGEITAWLAQDEKSAVYWVEVEEKSRLRVRLAS